MFTRLAEFRLFRSWGVAPRLQGALSAQEALPANDNLPPRRIRPQALVCHWSLIDGGTRLGCFWQPEVTAQTALEGPDSERTNNPTSQSHAIWLGRYRNLPSLAPTAGV